MSGGLLLAVVPAAREMTPRGAQRVLQRSSRGPHVSAGPVLYGMLEHRPFWVLWEATDERGAVEIRCFCSAACCDHNLEKKSILHLLNGLMLKFA